MKTVEIELIPCKVCGAKESQIFYEGSSTFKEPWCLYCNSCGTGEAEVYGKTKLEVVAKWNGLEIIGDAK